MSVEVLAVGLLVAAAVVAWPGGRGDGRVGGGRAGGGRAPDLSVEPAGRVARVRARLTWRTPDRDDGFATLELIEAMATQMRAGAAPAAAWQLSQEVLGGRPASEPGTAGWLERPQSLGRGDLASRSLGAAWQLADETGAPLAQVLDQLADGLRREAEIDAEVEASLAAPRSTARLLAALPLAGVALGELIGAKPVAVLVGTGPGRWCALGGLLLGAAGQLWTRRLVARVAALA